MVLLYLRCEDFGVCSKLLSFGVFMSLFENLKGIYSDCEHHFIGNPRYAVNKAVKAYNEFLCVLLSDWKAMTTCYCEDDKECKSCVWERRLKYACKMDF